MGNIDGSGGLDEFRQEQKRWGKEGLEDSRHYPLKEIDFSSLFCCKVSTLNNRYLPS